MSSIHWSEVQALNFKIIELMRDAARQDSAQACCRFGLGREALERVGVMTQDQVVSFIERIGEEPLFMPRCDLPSLLKAHPSLLPVLAAVPRCGAGHASAAN